jgi:cytosine deaminase
LELHTSTAAKLMGLSHYGLTPGCRADLVVLGAHSLDELLDGETNRRWVLKRGRIVAETEVIHRLHLH